MSRKKFRVNKKEVAKRIKKIRVIDLDLNQAQFAKLLGTTQTMVSRYERGTLPSADILVRIAQAGKTTIDYILLGGDDTKN